MRRLLQTRGPDALIAELAGRQYGVVARVQLVRKIGLGPSAIDRRLRLERLHRLHLGVYAVGHRVVSREGRWMAAVLACGDGAVLSHRSAAALWGIRSRPARGIEVTTQTKSRSPGGIHRHFSVLPTDEVTARRGIPVTTVPRMLFDLAAVSSLDVVEHSMRESERLQLSDGLSLEDLLARYPRRRGAGTIRECLRRRRELPIGVTREELEARFLAFLSSAGLPRPRLNAWLMLGARRFQVDCLWVDQRVIVELDGYATHGTRMAFEDDRDRDRRLAAAGYRGTRITWRHLHEIPGEIAADLRALLAQ